MLGRTTLLLGWAVVICWPVVAGIWHVAGSSAATEAHTAPLHDAWSLLWHTTAWSMAIALMAVVAAIPMSRAIASASGRLRAVAFAGVGIGLVLPPWAAYYVWWSACPPGTPLYDAAVAFGGAGGVSLLREALLGVAMLSAMWPVAVCCLVPASMRWTREMEDRLKLDGVGGIARHIARLRAERPGLIVAGALVALLTAGCTTAFDLAGVFTLANELRARADLGASVLSLATLTWPLFVLALGGAGLLWWWVSRPPQSSSEQTQSATSTRVTAACLWAILILAPVLLLEQLRFRVDWSADSAFATVASLWTSVGRTFLRACLVGFFAAALAACTRDVWRARGSSILGFTWVAAAMMPAPLVGAVVASAWGGSVLSSGGAWVLGLLVRGGAIGLLASRWAARTEAISRADLRKLDGWADRFGSQKTRAAAVAAGLIALSLTSSDISLAARLAPPMASPPLAVTMLNAIHYQRPETIVGVLALLPIPMIVVGLLLARCVSIRRVTPVLLICLVMVGSFGCEQDESASMPPLIPLTDWSGLPGRTPGRFDVPRGIAVDAAGDVLVVDKSARVQRLDGHGGASCVWSMPAFNNGKPTGLGVTADGKVIVADTHEYQVAVFNACGELQRVFGSYGMSPGQFIYPTDVVVSVAGEWFVSEYGGNDRVQVFDGSGSLRRVLGGPGRGSGQFRRPQGLALSGDGRVLWVADAGNHRVQGLDPMSGQMRVEIGVGTLRSPYGVAVLPDETLVVVENGRHVLSRWSPDGTLLGEWGGWGREPGRLRMPWGVAYEPLRDVVHVLDTGNSRVQQVPREALGLPLAQ